MSDICSICKDPLPENSDFALCSVNECTVHFACAGITEQNWNRWGQKRREGWKCKNCGKPSSTGNDEFCARIEKSMKEQFDSYKKELENKLIEFSQFVDFASNKIDEYQQQVNSFVDQVKEVRNENAELSKENQQLKSELQFLSLRFENLDQYSRNRNLQIDGIPQVEEEKMTDIIQVLAGAIGEPINFQTDIQAAHRVPTKRKSGLKPIVIQFSDRKKRDAVLAKGKRKELKSTDFVKRAPSTAVYVNEHLTQFTKDLLYEAKKLKDIGFKYVWAKDGKVLARRDENCKVLQIFTKKDVAKIQGVTAASKHDG